MQVISNHAKHNAPAAKFSGTTAPLQNAAKAAPKLAKQVLNGGAPHPAKGLAGKLHIPKA